MKIHLLVLFATLLSPIPNDLWAAEKKAQIALLKIDQQYESRTVVRKSTIPGAGNGLLLR